MCNGLQNLSITEYRLFCNKSHGCKIKLLRLCLRPILRSLGLFTVGQNKGCLFTPVVRLV